MNAVREVLRETRDDRLAEALLILAQPGAPPSDKCLEGAPGATHERPGRLVGAAERLDLLDLLV
jgi:hypothetical protein